MAIYNYGDYTYFEHSKSTTKSKLSRQIWDNILHERVRDKIFFKNFIGSDAGGEGDIWGQSTFAPIVEKNDFTKTAGDLITMQILQHINVNPATAGVVGNEILLGREKSFTFGYQEVVIDLWREAVGVVGGMNLKRNPIDILNVAVNQLSAYAAQHWDLEIFNTFFAGYSYNILRSLSGAYFPVDANGYYTSLLPTHPNTFWGEIGNTEPNNMTTSMKFGTQLLDDLKIWVQENNLLPVMYEGEPTWLVLISPKQEAQLRADPNWRNAVLYAKERASAWNHPLFKNMDYWWAGFAIFVTNRLSNRIARYYGKKTVGANTYGLRRQVQNVNGYPYVVIDESNTALPSADGVSGALPDDISANQVRACLVIGGNSAIIANGSGWHQERRKEDDYGFFYGFGVWKIYGMKRADWLDTINSTGGNIFNQSSVLIYTYTP